MATNQLSDPATQPPIQQRIQLTFDAEHPNRPHHRADSIIELLEVLDTHSVRATFFIQGRWASAYPQLAARIAESGHTIGSHSNAHVRMTRLTDQGIQREVEEAARRIEAASGANPKPYFRCPHGDGHDDPRVVDLLAHLGYRAIGWDVDPEDWNEHQSAADVVASIEAALASAKTSPVTMLLHTWPGWTPAVVRQLISTASERGRGFASLD